MPEPRRVRGGRLDRYRTHAALSRGAAPRLLRSGWPADLCRPGRDGHRPCGARTAVAPPPTLGDARALAIRPDFAQALSNRGNVLFELKRYEEALDSYDRALAIRPDFAQALSNRGNVLFELKRYEEALDSYDRALAIRPDFAQ